MYGCVCCDLLAMVFMIRFDFTIVQGIRVSRRSREDFALEKPEQSLKTYDYRAALFSYP